MKLFSIIPALIIASLGNSHGGLISVGEHVDLRWRWETTNGWTAKAVAESDPENPYNPDDIFLPLSDKPYIVGNSSISGARFPQSASPDFSFTGQTPGGPLWIAVQGTPGLGEAWPGFDNNQSANTFGSYISSDLRLSQSTPRPYITITLDSYIPPAGIASHFSMWSRSSNSRPIVWMSTYDQSNEDQYTFVAGTHTHSNWGFTALGIHRIKIRASAFLGPGQTNPTGSSAVETLTFAIGPFANWQATHFSSAELDEIEISGPNADPDHDGLKNIVEFGFGLPPRNGAAMPEIVGLGLPQMSMVEENGVFYEIIEYPTRRIADQTAPLVYLPEFSSDLSTWSDLNVVTTATDFTGSSISLNPVWQKVSSRRAVGTTRQVSGFGRVILSSPSS